MNRKNRRAQEAKTRQGQAPAGKADLGSGLWDKVHAAETATAAQMLEGKVDLQKVIDVVENAINFAMGFNNPSIFVACGEGCSYCCNQKVGSTGLEIIYIASYLNHERTEAERGTIIEGLRAVIEKRAPTESHAVRCNFLSDTGGCTIYDVRPLACRSVTSGRSEPCRKWLEEDGPIGKVADQRRYVGHHATMHGLDKGASARGFEGGFIDFHHALYIALTDKTAIERWYKGEHVFGNAHIPPKLKRLPLL